MESERSPIITIPRDLAFRGSSIETDPQQTADAIVPDDDGGYPVYLTEDWDSGIGGGLWTTGLALGRYFSTSQHFLEEFRSLKARKRQNAQTVDSRKSKKVQRQPSPVRVLELGSGNGFLGVCLVTAVAVAEANEKQNNPTESAESPEHWPGIEVVVTDTAEHLSLMRTTIESNLKRILPQIRNQQQQQAKKNNDYENLSSDIDVGRVARAEEYLWGEDYDFGGDSEPFDLIIGSDVAYRDYLHDPLIAALDEFCVPQHTVALIGVTMNDTKPIFFQKLVQRGFRYEKLADRLLGDEFCTSARQFGVFAISKKCC